MNIEEAIVDSRGGLFRSASKTAAFFFPIISFLLAMGQMIAQSGDASVTFKVGVHLVMVPVVVRDSKGQAVGNLTRDDFQLFDKGKRQEITQFTVEKAGGQAAKPAAGEHRADRRTEEPPVAPESFTAYLFDDVHLNFADLARVRRHFAPPPTLNEAIFGGNRVEGTLGSGASDYTVPSVNVTGINVDSGQAFGVGFAQGDFIQHNYHWRDILSHIRGAHTLKFGYEGWFGDDVEPFEGPHSQPTFAFANLLTLVQDQPTTEGGVMYDPTTGQPVLWSWNAASSTWGLFAEDTWKAAKNLTLTLGLRWDDSGNPYSRSATTVFGNFYFGPGATFQDQVTNGFAKAMQHALNHAVTDLLSPRIGFAWDPTGKGNWALRGGYGLYNNWLTQANVQEEFRGDPPGPITPTFYAGGTSTAGPPVFSLGTTNKPPFGFAYPTLTAGLNAQGGIPGAAFPIGGINPNLQSPRADIWAFTLERKISARYVASVGYSGSHTSSAIITCRVLSATESILTPTPAT